MSSLFSPEEVGLSLGGGTTGSAEVFSKVAVNRASKRENLSVSSVIWDLYCIHLAADILLARVHAL
jgi:hypothetical protein